MRLIDADELLEKLKQNLRDYRDVMNDDGVRATLIAVNDVEKAPTIDAEPVVHGHWIRCSDGAELQLICSHCGYEYIEADPDCTEEHNYCPHCGAKMDKEQEE